MHTNTDFVLLSLKLFYYYDYNKIVIITKIITISFIVVVKHIGIHTI